MKMLERIKGKLYSLQLSNSLNEFPSMDIVDLVQ